MATGVEGLVVGDEALEVSGSATVVEISVVGVSVVGVEVSVLVVSVVGVSVVEVSVVGKAMEVKVACVSIVTGYTITIHFI